MLEQHAADHGEKLKVFRLHQAGEAGDQSREPDISPDSQLIEDKLLPRHPPLPGLAVAPNFRVAIQRRQYRVRRGRLFCQQSSQCRPYFRMIESFGVEGSSEVLLGRKGQAISPRKDSVGIAEVRHIVQSYGRASWRSGCHADVEPADSGLRVSGFRDRTTKLRCDAPSSGLPGARWDGSRGTRPTLPLPMGFQGNPAPSMAIATTALSGEVPSASGKSRPAGLRVNNGHFFHPHRRTVWPKRGTAGPNQHDNVGRLDLIVVFRIASILQFLSANPIVGSYEEPTRRDETLPVFRPQTLYRLHNMRSSDGRYCGIPLELE